MITKDTIKESGRWLAEGMDEQACDASVLGNLEIALMLLQEPLWAKLLSAAATKMAGASQMEIVQALADLVSIGFQAGHALGQREIIGQSASNAK